MRKLRWILLVFAAAFLVIVPTRTVMAESAAEVITAMDAEGRADSGSSKPVEPGEEEPEKKNGWYDEADGHYYYIDDVRQTGWVEIEDDGTYFLGTDGKAVKSRWIAKDGEWYYFGDDYRMATNAIARDSKGYCYLGSNGRAVKNAWVLHEGYWYWFQSDCRALVNAWKKDSKGWCYLQADGRAAKSQWISWKGAWYYLKDDSRMAANEWANDRGGLCYLLGSGKAAKNLWIKMSGEWRYIGANYHVAKNDWGKDSKGWCYLDGEGRIVTSRWIKWSNKWYYLKSDGYMASSEWRRDSKGWCYLGSNGAMTVEHSSMMQKVENYVNSITNASMSKEQKLRKCFDSFDRFTERNPWLPHYRGIDWPEKYTTHLMNTNIGNCASYAAAFAYMAKIIGYEQVYACNSGGHGWAEINGLIYDPEWQLHHRQYSYYALSYNAKTDQNYRGAIAAGLPWMRVKI